LLFSIRSFDIALFMKGKGLKAKLAPVFEEQIPRHTDSQTFTRVHNQTKHLRSCYFPYCSRACTIASYTVLNYTSFPKHIALFLLCEPLNFIASYETVVEPPLLPSFLCGLGLSDTLRHTPRMLPHPIRMYTYIHIYIHTCMHT
jgi:hypothetical protein